MTKIEDITEKFLDDAFKSFSNKEYHIEVLPKIPMILISETDNEGNYYVAEYDEKKIENVRKICMDNGWTYKIGFDRGNYVSYIEIREK